MVTVIGSGTGAGLHTAIAACPAGKLVMGGGFDFSPSSSLMVASSHPLLDGTGWRVDLQRNNNAATPFTVYAICASTTA